MTNWRDDTNGHGLPIPNEDREGEFFVQVTDDGLWEVLYQCEFIDGFGWCWAGRGRKPRAPG